MAADHARNARRFYASPRRRGCGALPGLIVRLAPYVVRLSRIQQKLTARRLRRPPQRAGGK